MKKIIKLTEGELTNLIKRILKEDSTTNNCIKEYTNPESSTDPYIYRIGPECIWETKSDKTKKQIGRVIDDWESLFKNEKANKILDKWFPNAKSDCSKCKGKTTPKNDCPKEISCEGNPNPCNTYRIKACINSRKTRIKNNKVIDGKLSDCPKIVNCQPGIGVKPKICNNPKMLNMCQRNGTIVSY